MTTENGHDGRYGRDGLRRGLAAGLCLALALAAQARGAAIQTYGTATTLASGDYFVADDVSDISVDATGTTKKVTWGLMVTSMASATQTLSGKTIAGGSNTITGLASTSMANADWGHFTLAAGVATVDADVLTVAMMADGDWGSFTIAGNVATIDEDALTVAMMANGDWGFFSIAGNVATLDNDVVTTAHIADGDWGFFSVASGVATLDSGGLTSAQVAAGVTDETGTGSVVLATGPTITGLTVIGKYAHAGQEITLGAAATTFEATSNFIAVAGHAGTNTLATITGGIQGMRITMLFEDALVTVTDTDAHTANTVDLSAAFTSADDKVLELIYNGTSWYEVSRSTN